MDIIIYILSWNKVTENAIELYNIISKFNKNTYILNCDETFIINEPYMIQCDNSYYFTKQFFKCINHCLENHKESYLMTVTADVSKNANWESIIKNCKYGLDNLNAGIVAPNINYTSHIKKNYIVENNFWSVPNTDCTVWAINPIIYEIILLTKLDVWNKFGWGIDWILVEFCKKKNMKVLRDYNNLIIHPKGTGYSDKMAKKEFNKVKKLWNSSKLKNNL